MGTHEEALSGYILVIESSNARKGLFKARFQAWNILLNSRESRTYTTTVFLSSAPQVCKFSCLYIIGFSPLSLSNSLSLPPKIAPTPCCCSWLSNYLVWAARFSGNEAHSLAIVLSLVGGPLLIIPRCILFGQRDCVRVYISRNSGAAQVSAFLLQYDLIWRPGNVS